MINKIIDFSINNKFIVGLLTLALVGIGLWSMSRVPLDAVPDITNNQVQVITQAPNLGTEDIEQFVTYPIEVAVANLPGVVEIRSISRFGLSVVTIVFEDDMGTYLPRQLVAEKLNDIKEEIPRGFGEPYMGPISTGLGEIYQYTLKVDSAHKDTYSATDLRSIQDWIVRRQMAMVPGVVEVNAVGGSIKQYEVAVDPEELNAIGVTILDIYNALETNNQNTGGAYIEKNHRANFIRGEGLARNISDIENIVVKNENGIPILIKDVAKVRYGTAVRYGALTQDGEGEAVGGLVMMLKGANSNDVIGLVKERMKEIEKSLPEGVTIDPLLDRSELIKRTTSTISANLVEGALIVIFVLVFLLGNWRGGLIVASTIPLSLLFAFTMMHIFGVWANLMSLGAIDFGIIIDGAVIIVESTVFLLHQKLIKEKMVPTARDRDNTAREASSKMMNSAFFGQLIILIVFIPILALQGVEGKMFKPMAYTFMFAMLGVMILCLTYVPMMSAWFLRIKKNEKPSWGDRVVHWIENKYVTLLNLALRYRKLMVGSSLAVLLLAVFTFNRMGGEFVPQLDEGDLAFHVILKPGSSLSEAIKTTTKVEKIVKEKFPEVLKISSRIGVAEVPTDPMPFDFADVVAILKPRSEWTTTDSKEELIEMMKEAISEVPGVNYEFTQPIEMRFNELLEGVREDIAIKLYGEDIDILADKANEVARIITGTPGIGDMRVEATKGLPQMTVKYNRNKIAQYGLNIEELNTLIQSAFAGGKAGVIFEGEKRFDLVVRLKESKRKGIRDLQNLYINLPEGSQIPLREVADISYQPGPMQISRDNTNRRIYVGINVRGRDIKSLVDEISKKLDEKLVLPPGYYIRYGGAFENLERATKRLKLVVPIALALIFLLIYFALKSVKQTLMIYIAIPLAAIGGVFSLWLRDMPFSISAGIGFIVLFGVAVLNGLVLINGWNDMKLNGVGDLTTRIREGAKRRIRPILLTALTDILGFMPMAISTSAGAEVQRPLATVVIGGMITATLLTLFILPILYQWVENRAIKKARVMVPVILVLIVAGSLLPANAMAQHHVVTGIDEAIKIGMENNGNITAARKTVEMETEARKAHFNPGKTSFNIQYGQYNSYHNDFIFSIDQSIEFPTVYTNRKKLANARISESQYRLDAWENQLKKDIRSAWYELEFLYEKKRLLLYEDSLVKRFLHAATIRYETNATNYLEKATAETKVMEMGNELLMIESDIAVQVEKLKVLLNTNNIDFKPDSLSELPIGSIYDTTRLASNPSLAVAKQQIAIARAEKSLASAKAAPDFSIGYFNQSMIGAELSNGGVAASGNRFQGIQAGINIPIFFGPYTAQVKAAKIKMEVAQARADYFNNVLNSQYQQQIQQVMKYKNSIDYYKEKALKQADLILENVVKSFENGAISYIEFYQNMVQVLQLKHGYLTTMNNYNQSVIELEYLLGN